MSQTYQGIYSSTTRIRNRAPQIDSGMNEQLNDYQMYVDSIIDREIRSVLGNTDANGYKILLPLSGSFDIVDTQQMVVQLQMDSQIQMAADDLVIALFRVDKSENEAKLENAENRLKRVIQSKFGGPVSTDYDLTTDFLLQFNFTWDDGVPWALEDDSGLVLVSNTPLNNSFNNTNIPDSRVIFVPAPP